jgi:hypothetical protein
MHGGATQAAKAKARKRIEEAADRLARQLLGIAEGAESEAVRLAAVKDALDRAGVQAKTAAAVEVTVKPFEKVFDAIAGGPRNPQPALPAGESEIVDDDTDTLGALDVEVEVIDVDDPDPSRGLEYADVDDDATDDHELASGVTTPERGVSSLPVDAGHLFEGDESALGGPLGPQGPAAGGMMTLADAVEVVAAMRHDAAARQRAQAARRREARRR